VPDLLIAIVLRNLREQPAPAAHDLKYPLDLSTIALYNESVVQHFRCTAIVLEVHRSKDLKVNMITNRVGPPVRGGDFFGRQSVVDHVWQKLRDGNIMLAAPHRFGKTSLMYNLIDNPQPGFKLVHADLEPLDDPAALISQLAAQLAKDGRFAQALDRVTSIPKSVWGAFQRNVEEVDVVKAKIKLRQAVGDTWQQVGEELFKAVADSQDIVVFILDEFPMMIDRMVRTGRSDDARLLLRWLRALRQSPAIMKQVRFLIAGSVGITRVLASLGEIAAVNDFEQVRLRPFSKIVAFDMLDRLAKTNRLELPQAVKDAVLVCVGTPIPYFLQILYSEILTAHCQDDEPITPELVDRVYRDRVLGVDCKSYFEHYYGRLRDYYEPSEERAARRILRTVASEGSVTPDVGYQIYRDVLGEAATEEDYHAMMTDLESDFYIGFDDGRYRFSCKLLRDWWLRHYGLLTA
jgi:hypothetical protein